MSRYVDLSERILIQYYDEQLEEWDHDTVTVEDLLRLNSADDYTVFQSLEPQRMSGEWIFDDVNCKCSVCGKDPMEYIYINGFDPAYMDYDNPMVFCPSCGALMRKENNNGMDGC